MIGIIGKKLGMTQIFNEAGQQIPVTVVEATPNPVTKVTTREKAGFAAVELGYGAQKVRRASKKGEREPRGVRAGKAELGHAAASRSPGCGLVSPCAGLCKLRPGERGRLPLLSPLRQAGPRRRDG